jgi:hypothetical protein
MSDFATTWNLSRQRLVDEVKELSQAQLNWRPHPGCLTIGEMALHVAGVEVSFSSQLLGLQLDEAQDQLRRSATEGVVNDTPFPFSAAEITPELVADSLSASREMLEAIITAPTPNVLVKEIKSALGPIITGEGAFARMSFHPAYHQGQAYLVKNAPGYPSA